MYAHLQLLGGEERKSTKTLTRTMSSDKVEGQSSHSQNNELAPLKEKVIDICTDFCDHTSAHGWPRLAHQRRWIWRLVWFILTLGAWTAATIHILSLVSYYLQFPTELKTEVEMASIDFPSVTICNIQPISQTNAKQLQDDNTSLYYRWDNITKNYLRTLALKYNASQKYQELYNRLRQPIGFFENIGSEAIIVGHQSLDLLNSCTFGIKQCNLINFSFYQDPAYYNCHTFNGGQIVGNEQSKLTVRSSGQQEGLSLILYLESDNGDQLYNGTYYTYSNIGNAAGTRINVHPPNSRPQPLAEGVDIPPGVSASVGVSMSQYFHLDDPYGFCEELDKNKNGEEPYYQYTMQTCVAQCQQNYIMRECGCISALLSLPDNLNFSSAKFCATLGGTTMADVQELLKNIQCESDKLGHFSSTISLQQECLCYPPCREDTYSLDISYSYWPIDYTQQSFYQVYVLDNPDHQHLKAYNNLKHFNMTDLTALDLIHRNFVRVNIYLKNLVVTQHRQMQAYDWPKLFSDIGGTFGLWIGVSMITCCELIHLVSYLMFTLCKRAHHRIKYMRKNEEDVTCTSHASPIVELEKANEYTLSK